MQAHEQAEEEEEQDKDGKGQSEAEPHAESKPDCGNCDHAPLQDEGKGVDNY